MIAAAGCGSSRGNADARDGAGDGNGDASSDRRDAGGDTSGTGGSAGGAGGSVGGSGGGTAGNGGSTGGTSGAGGVAGSSGGSGGSAGTGGGNDAAAGNDGGGSDTVAPTCNDGIKNSDETGIDCGGHCGKCGPGNSCKVNADCTFMCRATDMTCAACNVAADCPGVESECEHRTCTAGVCGTSREAAGTVLSVQTTGDCKKRQCAGDGTVAVVNDDTDVPDDRNPCTNDICTSGAPSHTIMPANSNCGGANHCNASGQCVGCSVAADCPGTDTACRTRTCASGGVCGFSFTASGTKLVDPTAGDCKGLQCDGSGNSQVFNDNGDLPIDSNPCTTDECSSGTPSHRPVTAGANCGGSLVCDGASNCVECLSATTCPGSDTECHTRSCIAGNCGITNAEAGTLVSAQTPLDCKKNVCSAGVTVTVNDDTDLPVDGNPCTQDVCTAGTPSNPFVTAGNSCGTNTICDGQGACVTCLTASSCPGTDTDCHHRTCTNGACGIANTPAGTALTTQTAGDCKKVQCDGSGQTMTVTDDTDKPVDGNACTDDVCAGGVPSNPNLSSGTNCGTDLMCDGQGACVGCITAANCGTDTFCQKHTCTNGMCGVTNTTAGMALPTQTAGDCKKVQCDGTGQTQNVNDDTDLPVDNNTCTQDLCNAGIASNPPVTAGTSCSQNGGMKCNSTGSCVGCLIASDCPGTDTNCHTRTCNSGTCGVSNQPDGTVVTSQTTGDCKKNVCMSGNQVSVSDDTDVLVDGNGCTSDVCTNGAPSNPSLPANTPCSENGGTRCNGSATAPGCVQCLVKSQCGTDTECQTFACSAAGQCSTSFVANGTPVSGQTAGDCKQNVCNGTGTIVPAVDSTDVPVDGNQCTFDVCTNGNASNPLKSAGASCSQNGGTMCDNTGSCVQCLHDSDCGTDTFCKAFSCTNGVCGSSSKADGTVVPNTPVGDCHKDVCMGGNTMTVVDQSDVHNDGNPCTTDTCSTDGVPSNTNVSTGTSCGPSLMCDGQGACVGCITEADCPSPTTSCQTRVCTNGSCGFNNVADGTVWTNNAGDCHKDICMSGAPAQIVDDNDLPSTNGNQCLQAVCTNGTPTTPPFGAGVACNQTGGTECDGAGKCVECNNANECPGSDTECQTRTCSNGTCGIDQKQDGTSVPTQSSGDCKKNVCESGVVTAVPDDTDLPISTNQCINPMCIAGVPMLPSQAVGTACTQDSGTRCDANAACIPTFMVVRIGDGSAPLTSAATAVFVEERFETDGSVYRAIALPTSGTTPKPFTLSGVADSDGALALSADGSVVSLGGYSTATGTTGVAGTAATAVQRAAASITASGTVDTATTFGTTAFGGNNIRSAVSNNSGQFWAGGNGSGSTRGVFYALADTTGSTLIESASNSTRACGIFAGQLYCDAASGSLGIFKVGSGLPTTTLVAPPAVFTSLVGTTSDSNASYYSFAFTDANTLYIADERPPAATPTLGGGIQKWTFNGTTWTTATGGTFNAGLTTVGVRGLTAHTSSAGVVLIATTAISSPSSNPNSNAILKYVDDGVTSPSSVAPTTLQAATSGANRVYRGVAMAPHP